jgi:hypothetical protein
MSDEFGLPAESIDLATAEAGNRRKNQHIRSELWTH